MNGEVCCILGICCPPQERQAALSKELCHDPESPLCGDPEAGDAMAAYLLKHFDFAPAGTLAPLVSSVASMARNHAPKKK